MNTTDRTRTNSTGRSRAGAIAAVAAVGAVALLAPAAPAAASAPGSQDLTGATISCSGNLLTFTGGTQTGDLHRVVLGNGREVVILAVQLHDATLSDSTGATYRAVGGANSTALVTTEGDPGSLAGHFNVTINVLDHNGTVGKVTLRERTSRDGTVDVISSGGCSL